jgi:hypothetical protein
VTGKVLVITDVKRLHTAAFIFTAAGAATAAIATAARRRLINEIKIVEKINLQNI